MGTRIQDNLSALRERIDFACERSNRDPVEITLIAVTKRHGLQVLEDVLAAGLFDLGENRVQELVEKMPAFEGRARFHLIGQLQANKVNKVVGNVTAIHSVDRSGLLDKIERRAGELCVMQRVFLQVNVSDEAQKGGCSPDQLNELWGRALESSHTEALGLMAMAAAGLDETRTREQFAILRELADPLRTRAGTPLALSMGMSADFEWAIAEGATHLRLGTILVGSRPA